MSEILDRAEKEGQANIHLHVFFASEDLGDGKWYFFDRYGIYSQRSCYPSTFADSIHHGHAGYGIAWLNGKATMPLYDKWRRYDFLP
jgi:hypothetical protein